ncbi:MAG: DNA recombination protein RmuC [Chitinophagaceae bacterium]
MDTVLYILLGFISGFVLAWLFKKPQVPDNSALIGEIAGLRSQLDMARQEKVQLVAAAERLSGLLAEETKELRQSDLRVTELVTRMENKDYELSALKTELQGINERFQSLGQELARAQRQLHHTETELKFRIEQLDTNRTELEKIGTKFSQEFEILARKVLDEKTERFDKHQEKSLSEILTPLKENIHQFKTEFETKYNKESDDRISLREQIRHMMELNQTLSTQANNLTNALRGQVKQQGNWGEMMLESILEHADLQKGIHYFPQEHTTGEDGQRLFPDIIVRYPDKRSLVIDSKVSLLHYEQYCSATEPDKQRASLDQLLQSVYRHIDGLSAKKYQDAVGSLDFVLLFVPVEGAYITMMQGDRELSQYAYKKRVLLMSSTNLIAAMKLVYDLWKREGISQNAQEIAEKAVKIYEKLAAFIAEFEKVGVQIDRAGDSWRDAQKKLHTGKGSLISQAMQMKSKLSHNKPVRTLPKELEELAMAEEEMLAGNGDELDREEGDDSPEQELSGKNDSIDEEGDGR